MLLFCFVLLRGWLAGELVFKLQLNASYYSRTRTCHLETSIHIEPKNHEIVYPNKKEVDQGPWSISRN